MHADFLFPIFQFFQEGAADGVEVKYSMAQLPGWAKVILDFAIRMKAEQNAPSKKDSSRALVGFLPANAGQARVIGLTMAPNEAFPTLQTAGHTLLGIQYGKGISVETAKLAEDLKAWMDQSLTPGGQVR